MMELDIVNLGPAIKVLTTRTIVELRGRSDGQVSTSEYDPLSIKVLSL